MTEIKKLSVGGSLALLNSYNVEGQLLAMDAKGDNVRLITALARSEYEIYTDSTVSLRGRTFCGFWARICSRCCNLRAFCPNRLSAR